MTYRNTFVVFLGGLISTAASDGVADYYEPDDIDQGIKLQEVHCNGHDEMVIKFNYAGRGFPDLFHIFHEDTDTLSLCQPAEGRQTKDQGRWWDSLTLLQDETEDDPERLYEIKFDPYQCRTPDNYPDHAFTSTFSVDYSFRYYKTLYMTDAAYDVNSGVTIPATFTRFVGRVQCIFEDQYSVSSRADLAVMRQEMAGDSFDLLDTFSVTLFETENYQNEKTLAQYTANTMLYAQFVALPKYNDEHYIYAPTLCTLAIQNPNNDGTQAPGAFSLFDLDNMYGDGAGACGYVDIAFEMKRVTQGTDVTTGTDDTVWRMKYNVFVLDDSITNYELECTLANCRRSYTESPCHKVVEICE